ncbi:uncharacterized protein yc1106_03996 [Curvularia clavata]|uniref:Uncharacterized protein n=1 Tax=Curvularia clavata TaxID=95742 RepID=A0A9Q8Z5I7_CURCL|nr:uncharacterized protein yc1106_03996 [Curvularia clavata]
MASKLCCITEDERACSPEMLNVRLSRAVPTKQPLVPAETNPSNSHFKNDRSRDTCELRDISHNGRHLDGNHSTPTRPVRTRFSRPSMHSIHSLHKVKSMRFIIKKKLSKDIYKKKSSSPVQHTPSRDNSPRTPPNTVIRQQKRASKHQIQITKEALRNNLLANKKPNQRGNDSDAQVLNNTARNIDRKSPGKRPSIHSVDWVTTPGSKNTPESFHGHTSVNPERGIRPYDIYKTPMASLSKNFSSISSTPNLRPHTSVQRGRKLRRSHSTESMGLPKPLALSPLQIPSLVDNNTTNEAWSEAVNEGLHLSHFPVPPCHISAQTSQTDLNGNNYSECDDRHHYQENSNPFAVAGAASDTATASVTCSVEIRVQEPTLSATSRASTTSQDLPNEISPSATVVHLESSRNKEYDDDSRHSVHLQNMRISHHLRSESLLSWDKQASGPEISGPSHAFGEHSTTGSSQTSRENQQRSRYDRQTSSSGFSSSKVPARWGKVLPSDSIVWPDSASSVYSNKPQSVLGSRRGSVGALLSDDAEIQRSRVSSSNTQKLIRSATFPTDNGEIAKPSEDHELALLGTLSRYLGKALPHATPMTPLACKNSVADTKVSKFREEFSPPAPKKKLTQPPSIIKFLNPKRLGLRSQSDISLRSEPPIASVDGPSDALYVPANRQRRQSQSLMSLRTEQQALGRNKGANQVWDRALQAHQEEKASLFLPKNKDLAVHASPFRERSGSVSTKRVSVDDPDLATRLEGSSRRLSTAPSHATDDERCEEPPIVMLRRRALTISDESESGQDLANSYERQGDGKEVVGAWGRYPSHTRPDRVGSAGKADSVQPRDFALEAAIDFASSKDDEDMIGPTQRRPSTPLLPGEKKKKKRIGRGHIVRSSSMTLGRALMRNYGKMFKSQSTEFRRHGRGHRSSIASGGILEHPELELLPEVWAGEFPENESTSVSDDRGKSSTQDHAPRTAAKGKGRSIPADSMATPRRRRNSSAPNLAEFSLHDGAADSEHTSDSARIWSVYYKNCVDTYPRLSTDGNISSEDFNTITGVSMNNKQVSRQSSMMLGHLRGHSLNTSGVSHTSQANKCTLRGADDCAAEVKSLGSVRRSTIDLISQFQDQEADEHKRILGLDRE